LTEIQPHMTSLYMKLNHFEELATREDLQLYKREPNYIEFRTYEPELDAYDIRIMSAPIRENNTIVEFIDKMITTDTGCIKLKLREFEAQFIQDQGFEKIK
jgi:hypothetical protein